MLTKINYEVKGQLAKLLATEDLIIENRKVDTAMFDVERRVLTLPMWEKASASVYDLLVGHEVGHALYTPADNWKKDHPDLPMSYVYIIISPVPISTSGVPLCQLSPDHLIAVSNAFFAVFCIFITLLSYVIVNPNRSPSGSSGIPTGCTKNIPALATVLHSISIKPNSLRAHSSFKE